MNTPKLFLWGLMLLLAAPARADVRVSALSGTVEVRQDRGSPWEAATVGMSIKEGASVRTSGDGRAELLYPNKTHIWLKANTSLSIETRRSRLS